MKGEIARSQCAPLKGARSAADAATKKKGPKAVLGQAVGQRQGQVPHGRQVQRRDGARHHLAGAGPLRRDPDEGHPRDGPGARLQAQEDDHGQGGPQLPRARPAGGKQGQAAVIERRTASTAPLRPEPGRAARTQARPVEDRCSVGDLRSARRDSGMRGKQQFVDACRAGRSGPSGRRGVGGRGGHAESRRERRGRGDPGRRHVHRGRVVPRDPAQRQSRRRQRQPDRAVPGRRRRPTPCSRPATRRWPTRPTRRESSPARMTAGGRRRAGRGDTARDVTRAADPDQRPGRRQLPVLRLPLPLRGVPRLHPLALQRRLHRRARLLAPGSRRASTIIRASRTTSRSMPTGAR